MNWLGVSCVNCLQPLAIANHGLCSRCYRQIQPMSACQRCGAVLVIANDYCGQCLRHPPTWQRLVFAGRFHPPLSTLIHNFKFQGKFYYDRTLARVLLLAIKQAQRERGLVLPQLLIPVPLHRQRHWRRGYNQSLLLTQYLSDWLAIPYRDDLIIRIKNTIPQRGLSQRQRHQNIQNAFPLNPDFPQVGRVALIDDVVTTGSTVEAMSRLLLKQSIQQIQVWCVGKT